MPPHVVQQHIDLYVNDYSLNLDERAVERVVRLGEGRPACTALAADQAPTSASIRD